jgi:hypothetical protein
MQMSMRGVGHQGSGTRTQRSGTRTRTNQRWLFDPFSFLVSCTCAVLSGLWMGLHGLPQARRFFTKGEVSHKGRRGITFHWYRLRFLGQPLVAAQHWQRVASATHHSWIRTAQRHTYTAKRYTHTNKPALVIRSLFVSRFVYVYRPFGTVYVYVCSPFGTVALRHKQP